MLAAVFVPLGVTWVICAFAAGAIAKGKGRDYAGYFVLGLFLGVIGVLLAALASPLPGAASARPLIWSPSHEVPAGGIKAFGHPDHSGESIVVPGGTRLRLDETRGAWARVTDGGGASGWVDGHRLIPLLPLPAARCPFCAEAIQADAVVCRWCGRDLGGRAEPPPPPAE
jgi:hypothetical protein